MKPTMLRIKTLTKMTKSTITRMTKRIKQTKMRILKTQLKIGKRPMTMILVKKLVMMLKGRTLTQLKSTRAIKKMTIRVTSIQNNQLMSPPMRRMPKFLTLMKLMTLMIQQTRSTVIYQNSRMTMMTFSTVLVKLKSRQKSLSMRTKKLRMQKLLLRKMRPQLKF
jgi:hypothetical protein